MNDADSMHEEFKLDPKLEKETKVVADLKLSRILLQDNSLFPWVILVPRKSDLKEIIDLQPENRALLMEELSLISEVMIKLFTPDKLNVASLGNVVPQLHVHIIARYQNDSAWPNPVFGRGIEKYDRLEYQKLITTLKEEITRRI